MQQPFPYAALESTASVMRAMHELAGTRSPADAALEQPSLVARISVLGVLTKFLDPTPDWLASWFSQLAPKMSALVLGYHVDTCIALCGVPPGAVDGYGVAEFETTIRTLSTKSPWSPLGLVRHLVRRGNRPPYEERDLREAANHGGDRHQYSKFIYRRQETPWHSSVGLHKQDTNPPWPSDKPTRR